MGSDEQRKCGKCGYDIQGLDPRVICPECGTDSDKVKVKTGKSTVGEGIMGVIDSSIAVQGLEPVPDIRVRLMHFAKIAGFFTIALVVLQFLVTFAIIPIWLYRFSLFQE